MWRVLTVLFAALCLGSAAVPAEDNQEPPYGMMGGGMGMGPTWCVPQAGHGTWYGMMGGGMGMGPGMMGGMGMGRGMMGMGPYHMLNLSDEQRTKINKIQDDERRKHWETMGKVMDEQAKLRDLYDADKRDNAAILKVHDQIDQLHRKMREAHLNAESQIEALLTKEQHDQLKQLRRGGSRGMGMGPGMGPGGPRGGMRGAP